MNHCIKVCFCAAIILTFMAAIGAFGATPDSPRMERQYPKFMDGLMVPWHQPMQFSEQLDEPLAGFGNATSNMTHCCGVADCRFVQAYEDDKGHYIASVPRGLYGNTAGFDAKVPDNAIINDTPPGVREPMSAVLCARLNVAEQNDLIIYCFHPVRSEGWAQ